MRRLFFLLVLVLLASLASLSLRFYLRAGPDLSGPVVDVAWEDLDSVVTPQVVRVSGMAHYTATAHQTLPGGLFSEAKDYWLYGFFAPYDADGRAMRVLVRSPNKPETLVSYELVTITGLLTPVTPDKVSWETEVLFGRQSDYYFTDDMLLLEPLPSQETP